QACPCPYHDRLKRLSRRKARTSSRVITRDRLHASPDLVDDDAVVLIPFAVADAGLENLGIQPRERQVLSDLARLRQHEFHSLERLARAPFSREVAAQHLGALGVHYLRIGRRLACDLEEACGLKPQALRKDKPFRERQAVEAED